MTGGLVSALFPALRHRNFRLFFFGQMVSLLGTWMGSTAQAWLVLLLTDSPFYVGLVGALGSLPVLLVSLYAGAVADRMSKLRLIKITQGSAMLLAFALAVLTFADLVTVSQIMVIATLLGVVSAFDIPARQSFFVEMVGKQDLLNAIALNSSSFNVTRVLGPAVAGILIGKLGVAVCFLLNGLSFVAVMAALYAIRQPPAPVPAQPPSALAHVKEGLAYIRSDRRLLTLSLILATLSIFGFPYLVLLPVMVRDVLGRGAVEFGWMSSAVGAGAMTGALGLAAYATRLPKGRVVKVASLAFGVIVSAFALSRWLPLSLALVALTGFAMIINTATTNTLLQSVTPDELRGRVMSVFTFSFVGMGPIGAFGAGWMAEHVGAPLALVMGGGVCLAVIGAAHWRVPEIGEMP
ncbi:MAG TPA: MFS transporter [Gemmatimonadales bacterium]|nr:MFS transporter [Gemmatimonadales bacterium]